MTDAQPQIVLASTSPFRRELLSRLAIPFEIVSPEVDESPLPGETPEAMVQRLSEAKARAGAAQFPRALVIGSDQVAVVDGEVLGKPGDHERARAQLQKLSGRTVSFLTGLCLYNAASEMAETRLVPFRVRFRTLDEARIERYLRREQPYNCAGSFKSEGLGITLFKAMEGDDPTSLIGLPLITLTSLLAKAGVVLP
ncbi:MAG TPA: Maf family nucleotide pyrophosphatase [Gammaproteobacteria bacterium]|nr:Maf family nucleotide pyrophosphatase [Gammaproteobacteria bacterium]